MKFIFPASPTITSEFAEKILVSKSPLATLSSRARCNRRSHTVQEPSEYPNSCKHLISRTGPRSGFLEFLRRSRKAGFVDGATLKNTRRPINGKGSKREPGAWRSLHDHGPDKRYSLFGRGKAVRQRGGRERERELWGASVYLRGQRRQAARYGGAVEKHDENGVATAGGRTQANPNASQGVAEPGHSDPTSRTTSILTPWLRQVLVCSCFPYAHRHRRRCVTDRTYVAPKASE